MESDDVAIPRVLYGHDPRPRSSSAVLAELAEHAAEVEADFYGTGSLLESFEEELATLLGKPSAMFMPSGIMAQQCALRIWADRTGVARIATHPRSHVIEDEESAHAMLHGLTALPIGSRDRVLAPEDVEGIRDPLGTLLLELPQRRIGGQLPGWVELDRMVQWARSKQIPVHLDGARLWESAPYYSRTPAEIAALFDTVYVSFYKGLGALAGAVLAGPRDVVELARVWRRRHGGTLVHLYPYVISARLALTRRLDRFAAYHRKALEIAAGLDGLDGVEIVPRPPHTNMIHVFLRSPGPTVHAAHEALVRHRKIRIFPRLTSNSAPAWSLFEIQVGDAAMAVPTSEIVALVEELTDRVRTG